MLWPLGLADRRQSWGENDGVGWISVDRPVLLNGMLSFSVSRFPCRSLSERGVMAMTASDGDSHLGQEKVRDCRFLASFERRGSAGREEPQ